MHSSVRQSHSISETTLEVEVIPSLEAGDYVDGYKNKDCRPRLKDGKGITYLLDSGSMTGVWPASPGDKIDPNIGLKAVNGESFDCYGIKEIEIKIGRKAYKMEVVIAKVKSPILGWDFFKKYKLDLVWGR